MSPILVDSTVLFGFDPHFLSFRILFEDSFDTFASRIVVVTTIDCSLALPLLLSRGPPAWRYVPFPKIMVANGNPNGALWWHQSLCQELPHIAPGARSRIRQISWQSCCWNNNWRWFGQKQVVSTTFHCDRDIRPMTVISKNTFFSTQLTNASIYFSARISLPIIGFGNASDRLSPLSVLTNN